MQPFISVTPNISSSLSSKVDLPLSLHFLSSCRCARHECSVRSPPGVSAERNPDNQRCLPLKVPVAGGDLWPSDTAPEVATTGGNTDIQLCSKTVGEE